MDEFCDWEGRLLPSDHPYSFRRYMATELYGRIRPELRNGPGQVIFPEPTRLEEYSEQIEAAGGVDTTYAGFGFRGHLGFNDTPARRWTNVSLEELRQGKTRVVQLSDDTMVALSQCTAGRNSFAVPPMAVTIGMKDILSAKTVHLVTDGGAWKQYIVRVLLLGEPDVRFPVTLCQEHPDCTVSCDALSVAPIVPGS